MTEDQQTLRDDLGHRVAAGLAAVLAAVAVVVVGTSTIDPETARAAGVVLDHRPWQPPA